MNKTLRLLWSPFFLRGSETAVEPLSRASKSRDPEESIDYASTSRFSVYESWPTPHRLCPPGLPRIHRMLSFRSRSGPHLAHTHTLAAVVLPLHDAQEIALVGDSLGVAEQFQLVIELLFEVAIIGVHLRGDIC
jgi:hypothetical protein